MKKLDRCILPGRTEKQRPFPRSPPVPKTVGNARKIGRAVRYLQQWHVGVWGPSCDNNCGNQEIEEMTVRW